MSKINQFNSNNSEFVRGNQRPQGSNTVGGGLLPSNVQTSQGSNGIDTPEGVKKVSASEAVNPHGSLLRNPNISSLAEGVTEVFTDPSFSAETLNGTSLTSSGNFVEIAVAFNSASGLFAQAIPTLSSSGTVSAIIVKSIYSGTSTANHLFSGSSTNGSGIGWIQSGNNIVWTSTVTGTLTYSGAAVFGFIPKSGSTYGLDITYTDSFGLVTSGGIQVGNIAPLSVPSAKLNSWIGNNVFGKSTFGEPEVTLTSGTRDTITAGTNQNPRSATDVIPNVGSRFFR